MKHQLNTVKEKYLKIVLKTHKGITQFMTNLDTSGSNQIDGIEKGKVTNYKYLNKE